MIVLLMCLLVSGVADASEEARSRDETSRWIPSIGFFSGIVAQDGTGKVSTSGGGGNLLRPSAKGDDTLVTPMVGGEIELMTPGLASLPGRPRLFVRAGVSASFAADKDLAKEGNPGPLSDPGVIPPQADAFPGQGSATNVEVQSPFVSAGAGVAFSFDIGERRVRLKSSVEYLRQEIEVTGISNRVLIFGVPLFVEFEGRKTGTFHALGPGLEVEVDAMRTGSLMTSVFLSTRIYHFLGNRDIELTDRITTPIGGIARWKYEQDPWAYRAHVGFRIRWQPE
jgi:hypothetical protein